MDIFDIPVTVGLFDDFLAMVGDDGRFSDTAF
ncbi:hypothetical protein JOH49_009540 [Bradyrhizobium elkanii]|uniref:Uncharacterized protein n=1 Tax=Bradyrhizobium elkanii TaxID=29448 RepID=A0A8I1YHV1_BRAEL|nr:hypothetical protein [Bradyrhizobium elkanii]